MGNECWGVGSGEVGRQSSFKRVEVIEEISVCYQSWCDLTEAGLLSVLM